MHISQSRYWMNIEESKFTPWPTAWSVNSTSLFLFSISIFIPRRCIKKLTFLKQALNISSIWTSLMHFSQILMMKMEHKSCLSLPLLCFHVGSEKMHLKMKHLLNRHFYVKYCLNLNIIDAFFTKILGHKSCLLWTSFPCWLLENASRNETWNTMEQMLPQFEQYWCIFHKYWRRYWDINPSSGLRFHVGKPLTPLPSFMPPFIRCQTIEILQRIAPHTPGEIHLNL